jgi:hypothetical protein
MMSERALLEAYEPLLSLSSLALTIEPQFDERPAGFNCPSANKIQSYCDASDPYCCNGSNAATHQGYGAEYGAQALTFIKTKLSAS